MEFLRNNWIYIVIAFGVVFLAGIGYITYSRLNQLSTLTQPSEPTTEPVTEVELSFQITPQAPTPIPSECLELVATPLSGPAPLSVSFTGLASDTSDELLFVFDFGDDTSESVQYTGASPDELAAEIMSHTYTEDGTYTAALSIETPTNVLTSTSCTIDITVGETEPKPTTETIAQGPIVSPTLIPTLTSIPQTISPTLVPTSIPTPTTGVAVPDIPQAGSYLPTLLAIGGAILIMFLAFAVL